MPHLHTAQTIYAGEYSRTVPAHVPVDLDEVVVPERTEKGGVVVPALRLRDCVRPDVIVPDPPAAPAGNGPDVHDEE